MRGEVMAVGLCLLVIAPWASCGPLTRLATFLVPLSSFVDASNTPLRSLGPEPHSVLLTINPWPLQL